MVAHRTKTPVAVAICIGLLRAFADGMPSVEVQTPFANELGSGWLYYVAHTINGTYASDYRQHCIRKNHPATGEWLAWAGACHPSSAGFRNAKGTKAQFSQPHGICVTPRGDVVVADTGNNCVRVISQAGLASTLAGKCGHPGDVDGAVSDALFSNVLDVQCLSNCSILVTEPGAGRIRLIRDISGTCPASKPTGTHAWLSWNWLLHWYVLAVVVVVGLVTAVVWFDARSAGVHAHLKVLLAEPPAPDSSDIDAADTERRASLARLTMARIFSMQRSNTMRRTQSDSIAAEHTFRTRSERRAERAAIASQNAAAIMQCKREGQSDSPHGHYTQSPRGRTSSTSRGHDISSPHGFDNQSHAPSLLRQHFGSSTPQQSVDPNTDVFQLFDAGLSTPEGLDRTTRGSTAEDAEKATAEAQPRITF